jgi:glycosyltransferase involved in cell wall biosynthesis
VISDRELLRTHYAAADLFLFPSLYDNAPLVVREAAVMGTPSVIVAGSTTAEVIDDGVNGFLACNSAESYAAVVRTLYDNRRLLLKVAANASHSLARSWNDVMEEVVQRYTDVIKRYGSKRHK